MKLHEIQLFEFLEFITPSDNPKETITYDGLIFHREPDDFPIGPVFTVFKDKTWIGAFNIDLTKINKNIISVHVEIDDKYQRKGYGSKIYNYVSKLAKKQNLDFQPSTHQTDVAKHIWKKRLN